MDEPQEGIRASDAEREQAVTQLKRHLAEGRLRWEEFSERMDRAYQARTRGELRAVLADLPQVDTATGAAGAEPPRPWWRRIWWAPALTSAALLLAVVLLGAAFGHAVGDHHRGLWPFPLFPLWPLLLWWLLWAGPARRWRRW